MEFEEEKLVEEVKQATIKCYSTKELKNIARPKFAAEPDKYYPTETLRFSFWWFLYNFFKDVWDSKEVNVKTLNVKTIFGDTHRKTCGDSNCEKRYSFIGNKMGVGKERYYSYSDSWEGFKKSLSTPLKLKNQNGKIKEAPPCIAIPRYPVVARWRDDVDFVVAGIFCFQPYCVTGELEPPANPLICNQFCLRFNDLDNIGLTGRHFSGFVMLGIQVFNKKNHYVFFKDEYFFSPSGLNRLCRCVEHNYRWLTEELKIDPDEITFIEDVWAGGGNLGPSIEYFVGGLELGNMVFMQYRTDPTTGNFEELDVQVIDTGIGLERIPWLINGEPNAYIPVFTNTLSWFQNKLNIVPNERQKEVWNKFGPYSCLLNADEVGDEKNLNEVWNHIEKETSMTRSDILNSITESRLLYLLCDHLRTVMVAVRDGCLPSNQGGAANVRNLIRRVFSVLDKQKGANGKSWWEMIDGMKGLMEAFEEEIKDYSVLYGKQEKYTSFSDIIEIEYRRWKNTEDKSITELNKRIKKRKPKSLTLQDWVDLVTAYGLDPYVINKVANTEVPGNLYLEIASQQEKVMKEPPRQLYTINDDNGRIKPTLSLYDDDHHRYNFDAELIQIIPILGSGKKSIVILDKTCFYPTSGGQEHDEGIIIIKEEEYKVIDVLKNGPFILHFLNNEVKNDSIGMKVMGKVDEKRRSQIRIHHTATHTVMAACRRVLGPHIWQHGAKKTVKYAHIDITHYSSLTIDQMGLIELEANKIVMESHSVEKKYMKKEEAEKEYGFSLYQGGAVAGARIVKIKDVDTEACCGTHVDNTSEIGGIKIIRANRISDGILRIYFVAGELAFQANISNNRQLYDLCSLWSVQQKDLQQTAERFFKGYKSFGGKLDDKSRSEIALQLLLVFERKENRFFIKNDGDNLSNCIINKYPKGFLRTLKELEKAVIFLGRTWIYGISQKNLISIEKLKSTLSSQEGKNKEAKLAISPLKIGKSSSKEEKKEEKKAKESELVEIKITGLTQASSERVANSLREYGFIDFETIYQGK